MSALTQVQDIESYARRALNGCGGEYDYNVEKALRILRTCVVSSIEVQMTFYASLRAYNPRWILEITQKTISATIGLVGMTGARHYASFEATLQQTVKEHFEAENAALRRTPSKKKSAKKSPSLSNQIDDLRDKSRLTVEDLAEGVGLAARSVYRHLSGEAIPRKRQIAAYEALFTKKLSKPIHLETSSQRQPNVTDK
jgi:hypothetical protein